MKVFIACVLIGLAVCDKLPTQQQSAPYAPSGWKPSGAQLALPSEYGPPQAFRKPDIQVTQERVQFAGQQQTSETTTQLSNEYLPPPTTILPDQDVLRVQGLPNAPPATFNGQLNTGEILSLQQLQQQRYSLVRNQQLQQYRLNQLRLQQQQNRFQDAPRPTSAQLKQQSTQRQQQQRIQFQQQQQQQQQPQQQYGAPLPQQQYGAPKPQEPSNQYGPPATPLQFNPAPEQPQQPEQNFDADSETEDVDGPSVAVANSVNNGQYYILAEDNTLQRVVYMTSQTEDDRRNNGFTAQLQYAPVEPIRDPIYAYDTQGQLVRIYNK